MVWLPFPTVPGQPHQPPNPAAGMHEDRGLRLAGHEGPILRGPFEDALRVVDPVRGQGGGQRRVLGQDVSQPSRE
jgi:hypothetical protein